VDCAKSVIPGTSTDRTRRGYPREELKVKGWKEREDDTQIGQLLYYMTAVQLRSLSLGTPHPVLGIFMEEGMVCPWSIDSVILHFDFSLHLTR